MGHLNPSFFAHTPSSDGEGNEGNEGHEEEACEQGCEGPPCQGNGAARKQGEDHWRSASQGPVHEQVWQDREQEGERRKQGPEMVYCRQEGTRCLEDQGLPRHQEGHPPLPEGTGVHEVSAEYMYNCGPTASERWWG